MRFRTFRQGHEGRGRAARTLNVTADPSWDKAKLTDEIFGQIVQPSWSSRLSSICMMRASVRLSPRCVRREQLCSSTGVTE